MSFHWAKPYEPKHPFMRWIDERMPLPRLVYGAVGGGYDNTDVGRMVTLSFIQAYSKLVTSLNLVGQGSEGTAEAAPTRTYSAIAPVALHKAALATSATIRTLPPGSILYPTGKKDGLWWEVADENDNVGWVLNTKLAPSK